MTESAGSQDAAAEQQARQLGEDVSRYRASMMGAMSDLEAALASPAGPDGARWLLTVSDSVNELGREIERHIEIHEGPNAFHQEVVASHPYLAPRVGRLQREHVRARQLMADLMAAVIIAQEGSEAAPDTTELRMLGSDLLLLLVHHRQRGADLVWDSINLDLGAGD